ncbi:hypothetical protein DH2020_045786 [Rehmannia glutinosa]|uniref:Uncharacterized protein n=1 Tax=Rehmannia glutinosa TaxID=99300 RepID=A0ABR0UEW0_REHGL
MSNNQYDVEGGTSTCKQQLLELRASTSNHSSANLSRHDDVYSWRRKADIIQLEGRLSVLEEEGEMLKGALFESMDQRRKLMTEINEQFDNIQHCLFQREVNRGELYGHGVQIITLLKDRRAGLLQVLCQESNPSIVNKGLRAKALDKYSTQSTDEI